MLVGMNFGIWISSIYDEDLALLLTPTHNMSIGRLAYLFEKQMVKACTIAMVCASTCNPASKTRSPCNEAVEEVAVYRGNLVASTFRETHEMAMYRGNIVASTLKSERH